MTKCICKCIANKNLLRTSVESFDAQVIIYILGSLGEHGELKEFLTDYDIQLQKSDHCHYKNQQVFEKMLTARYVPELFRIICKVRDP